MFLEKSFFLSLLLVLSQPNALLSQELLETNSKPHHNINVVVFFANAATKLSCLQKDSMDFLNFHKVARVKHNCHGEATEAEKTEETSKLCKDLLKESLMTLTHYCHSVLKMKTAIAAVSSTEISNDIQEPEAPYHPSNVVFESETPKVKRALPILHYEQPSKNTIIQPNNENNKRTIITTPKHTEVFQIRVKRKVKKRETEEDVNVPYEGHHKKKPKWDVLDVMKHVRYSFLGKMFEDKIKNRLSEDEDDFIDIGNLGKEKEDPGLFETVKSTLTTLQDTPEANFLMVVFGGHLHGIKNKHSPMIQSVKHVMENTNAEDTLIIVTGSCIENENKEESAAEEQEHPETIPVYARGPKCDILSECNVLYDLPLTIQKILGLENGSGFEDLQAENSLTQ
ncbi:uncharacterized protein LOC115888535 [Sitophilus oryzae]|uniref:Uncharacterized protein LOC115888535 n=1 Tax=Sitophilus oryzae TaxID=7048 RepID=A0A6J2YL65_SITOR|nr:uncharacterized protein LOC115888535 [Sitophilus oryzae]